MLLLKSIAYGSAFAAAITIDQATLIPVGTVITIGGGIWYLGRKLQQIDDRLENGDKRFERIEAKLESLPCNSDCGLSLRPKHK